LSTRLLVLNKWIRTFSSECYSIGLAICRAYRRFSAIPR